MKFAPLLYEAAGRRLGFHDDRLTGFPVGGDLQNGRPAKAAMREQDILPKRRSPAPHVSLERNTAEIRKRGVQRQRNQGWTNFCQAQPKLPSRPIAEVRRAE